MTISSKHSPRRAAARRLNDALATIREIQALHVGKGLPLSGDEAAQLDALRDGINRLIGLMSGNGLS